MTGRTFRAACLGIGVAVTSVMFQRVGLGHDREEPLIISQIVLVDRDEVDRHIVEETYRAELRHTAPHGSQDFAAVAARIVHPFGLPFPGKLQIVDGDVEFGSVRVGQTVESRDTFTIRRHQNHPLKAHHLRWAVSGRPDLILSDAWAGEWRLTITAKDPDSGSISSVDEVTDSLGAGGPVGLSLLPDFVRCTWSGSDDVLEAACAARFRFDGCLGDGSANVSVEREGDVLTGGGEWEVTATGTCGERAGNGGASIEIAGVRLRGDVEAEPFSPGILTRLAATPALSGLLVDRLANQSEADPPASDADCARGRWRHLTNPSFRNARDCRSFVERRHGAHRHDGGL